MNELLLIASLFLLYAITVLSYRFFGKTGLYCMTVFATVTANIEVLITVKAFGLEQTLGNVLFASTFLITDILNENEGKKNADKAVLLGIFTSVLFMLVTQSWLLYSPSDSDLAMPSIEKLFAFTPRLIFASLTVYAVTQLLDVRLYSLLWKHTEKKSGSKRKFLWLRNNLSSLTSQLVNAVLFNLLTFYGIYSSKTLISIIVCSFIISAVASAVGIPAVYICRHLKEKNEIGD